MPLSIFILMQICAPPSKPALDSVFFPLSSVILGIFSSDIYLFPRYKQNKNKKKKMFLILIGGLSLKLFFVNYDGRYKSRPTL